MNCYQKRALKTDGLSVYFSVFHGLNTANLYYICFYLNLRLNKDRATLRNVIKTANIIIVSFLEDGVILEFNEMAEKFWL